jgi:xanthine dehydrogenase YagR molybdenum-binding subunit
MTATRLATLDLPEGNAMRAPGEASGMMALEIAMDEMAEKLGTDPIEFRILNDTQVDPEKPERPFSQRQLVECFRIGAERFCWSKRNAQPGRVREGRWLVGIGTAAAFRNNQLTKSAARVRLDRNGVVTVETDMTDIGTGSYTIIAQTAAEMIGVPLDKVVVRSGDSSFPVSAGSGGQWGGNNSTAGVYAACVKLREEIAQKLGFDPAEVEFADSEVRGGNRRVPLAQAAGEGSLSAEDGIEYGDLAKKRQQSTFGAHFVEVGVDAATAEIRVRRMLAVCAAGRILNPKTARSQVIGAMTMGVGAALMEELVVDKRAGFFVNHDLASYEVPVHADIPRQEMIFLDETDPMSSPMKAKGVAELGICGVARRSPTRPTTPRESVCAIIRSRSTSCSTGCRTWVELLILCAIAGIWLRCVASCRMTACTGDKEQRPTKAGAAPGKARKFWAGKLPARSAYSGGWRQLCNAIAAPSTDAPK